MKTNDISVTAQKCEVQLKGTTMESYGVKQDGRMEVDVLSCVEERFAVMH